MASRPTTINLDDETKAIASTIPNLSWFVREALRTHRDLTKIKMVPDHTSYDITLQCCNPFTVYGVCSICWVDGPPLRRDWLEFQRMKRANMNVVDNTSGERTPITHRSLVTVNQLQAQPPGASASKPRKVKKGLVRRFLAWFW